MMKSYNFLEYAYRYKKNDNFRFLFKKIVNSLKDDEQINPDLWEISYLYRIVIFQKTDGPNMFSEVTKTMFKRCDIDDELMTEDQ